MTLSTVHAIPDIFDFGFFLYDDFLEDVLMLRQLDIDRSGMVTQLL